MGVHRERPTEAGGFVELLVAPAAKRRWSDEAKGRIVAETLLPGIPVNEVTRRHAVNANHLSAWRMLARKGELAVPEIAGAAFAGPVSIVQPVARPVATPSIDLIFGFVTVRRKRCLCDPQHRGSTTLLPSITGPILPVKPFYQMKSLIGLRLMKRNSDALLPHRS